MFLQPFSLIYILILCSSPAPVEVGVELPRRDDVSVLTKQNSKRLPGKASVIFDKVYNTQEEVSSLPRLQLSFL